MTQEEFLTGRGYVRYKGAWWTQQQAALDAVREKREIAEKQWRRQIKIWLDQLGTNDHERALAGLRGIQETTAGPALADILGDEDSTRPARMMCLDILARLPPGLATGTLVRLAMDDPDENIRDKCLDELIRLGPHVVLSAFMNELKNEKETAFSKNARINRAAYCLQRFGDPDATLPLINALVTEHFVIINPDAAGGGTPVNFNSGGPVGQGGLGGLSMGSKQKKVKGKVNNPDVLGALTSMYPGVNYLYNIDDWKRWYIQNHTSTSVDLRRGE
jgi:HEAT repeat protein